MAIGNPSRNASTGNWEVTITQNGTSASKTLSTKNTYVDGDIVLNESAANAIVFGNEPASGKTATSYTTIDDSAPVLISGGYLYINEGYITDSKISLAKLVPDGSDVGGHSEYILSGHSAYDNAGVLVAGSIPTLAMTSAPLSNYYTTTDTGYGGHGAGYINANYSIKGGTLSNGTASFSGGAASSTTTITAVATSPANKGAAINYNDNKCGGSSEAAYYVTIAASGTGGAAAVTASGSTGVSVAGWVPTSSTASVSGTKSAVSTTSSDTNYIKASAGGSVTGNSGSFTTSTAITATTTSPSNKGRAVNYNDNKCGGSSEAAYYVYIDATSTGSGSAGTAKSITVKDTYMLDDLSVSAPAPTKGTSSGDTNYIKASNDSSITANAATISGSTSATATATAAATASGSVTTGDSYFLSSGTNSYKVVFEADAEAVATANATSSGSASATAGADKTLSVKDTYMLNNVAVKSAAIGSTALTGGSASDTKSANDSAEVTKYIKAGSLANGSASFSGGGASSSTTIEAVTTAQTRPSTAGDKGKALNYNDTTGLTNYVTISASGTGGAAKVTSSGTATVSAAGWIPTTATATVSGEKAAVSTSSSDKNYIKATVDTQIAANAVTVSAPATVSVSGSGSATASVAIDTGESYFLSSGTNSYKVVINGIASATASLSASASGTATATAGADKTFSVKDTYMLNDVTIKSTGGTGSISGSATGSASISDGNTSLTKYIKAGSATTPATTITSAPSMSGAISSGYYVVTGTNSKTQNVTPTVVAGWVASGTAGTITVNGSNTHSIPVYGGEVA